MPHLFEIPEGYETKMKLLEALNALMKEQHLDTITVADICRRAEVTRQTFYRHFADRYEAVNWYNELFDQNSLIQIGRTLTWNEGHRKKYEAVKSEPDFFLGALKSQTNYNSLIYAVARNTVEQYTLTVTEFNNIELTKLLEFQIHTWSRTAAEIATEWLFNGMKETPEELAELADSCVPRELFSAMNDPVLARRKRA